MNPDKRQETMNGKRLAKFWMAKFRLTIKQLGTTSKTALTLLMVLSLITPTYLAVPSYFNSNDPVELQAADAPPTEGRTRSGRVPVSRQSPQRGVEAESIETQMGEAAEAFTPWRAKGENAASLGLSQSEAGDYAQQVTALVGFNPFQLATGYGQTDLRRGIDPSFAAKVTVSLTRGESAEQQIAIVLPVLPNQLSIEQHLKDMGAKVLYPVTPHGYAVKANNQVMANLSADSMVYAIAQRPSQMKFDPTLAHELGMASPNFAPGDEKSIEKGKANLQIFDSEDRATVKAAIESLGVKIDRYDEQTRVFKLSGFTAAAMRRLSQMPEIAAITSENENKVAMDEAVSAVNHTSVRENGFEDDNGVIIGMIDSGMQHNHTAFAGRGDYAGVYGLAWNVSGEGSVTNDNSSGHGTHVAGIMLSRWYDYWSFPWTFRDLRGMAPRAGNSAERRFRWVRCGKDSDDGRSINNTEQAMDILKNDNQALVINNSWGSNDARGTNSDSIKADQVTWDTQQIYVFAAGNDGTGAGTINSPASAKNVIAVGGTDKSKNIYTSSSEGPTSDGRMKPDIYAPGVSIRSADAANTGSYAYMTGTSMAAPVVTGFLSTLLGHYTSFQRRPAVAKAVMMAAAERRSGLQSHTGVLDSYNTHWTTSAGWSRWGWTDSDVRGQEYTYWDIDNVPSGVKEMRVILTWIEPAAELNASKAVKNDIDLYVDYNKDNAGEGGDWHSWSGNDNVEVVTITNPQAGNFRIKAHKYSASADYRLGMAVYFKK